MKWYHYILFALGFVMMINPEGIMRVAVAIWRAL